MMLKANWRKTPSGVYRLELPYDDFYLLPVKGVEGAWRLLTYALKDCGTVVAEPGEPPFKAANKALKAILKSRVLLAQKSVELLEVTE